MKIVVNDTKSDLFSCHFGFEDAWSYNPFPAWAPAQFAMMSAVVLFVTLVLVPALNLVEGLRKMLLAVCMKLIAFLLAMKILIRRHLTSTR